MHELFYFGVKDGDGNVDFFWFFSFLIVPLCVHLIVKEEKKKKEDEEEDKEEEDEEDEEDEAKGDTLRNGVRGLMMEVLFTVRRDEDR